MKTTVLILCLATMAGISLTCSKSEDKVVARLGDQVLTVGMIEDQYLAISPASRPELPTIDEQEQFARDVVSKEILAIEARKIGIDRLPEVMDTRKAALQRKGWEVFYRERVKSRVEVTEEDIRELYEKQKYSYHLLWIFVRSKALADEVAGRLAGGEDFRELAEIYSMDPSRTRQGDIGARPLGTLPQSVEDIVKELSPGDVTDPIADGSYYVIIKVESKTEQDVPDFEAAGPGLEAMTRTRRETALQREMAKELKEKYGLTFNRDALETIAQRTRERYPTEDVKIGFLPEFSDEELARTLAEYDGGEWRIGTYAERMKAQAPTMRPGYRADDEAIKSVIGDFITGELWMVEIRNEGYDQRPEVVNLANRVMEEAMVTAMHDELIRGIETDDEDLRSFYEEQKSELMTEPSVLLAVIVLETQEEADDVHRLLEAGGSFEDLARERSLERTTGENGGVMGGHLLDRQLEQFPDVHALIGELDIGAYSSPSPMPLGFLPGDYGIFKVLERTESKQMSFNEVKSMLGERVLQLKQDKVLGEWLKAKMEEYGVEIYPDGLASIDFEELRRRED